MFACFVASVLLPGLSDRITIAPELRTYEELVQLLAPGSNVECDAKVKNRLCVVGLRDREIAEARRLIAKGLHLGFTETSGQLKVTEDPAYAADQKRLLQIYVRRFDNYQREVYRNVDQIWSAGRLPTYDELDLLSKQHLQIPVMTIFAGPGGPQQANAAPIEQTAAMQLLASVTTDAYGPSTSAPIFFYFKNGGSISDLIPNDDFDSGNAAEWASWSSMPEWVRTRATTNLRQTLEGLKGRADPLVIEGLARDSRIVHRTSFDPLWRGGVNYEFAVISNAEAAQGWYRLERVSYLNPPAASLTLTGLYKSAGRLPDYEAAVNSTRAVLTSNNPTTGRGRMSEAMANWQGDVIGRVSAVRDQEPIWLGDGGSFGMQESDGVLFVSNWSSFLDSRYDAPLGPYLEPERQKEAWTLDRWVAFARTIKEQDNAAVSRCRLAPQIREATAAHPFLTYLSAMGKEEQASLYRRLKNGESVTLDGRGLPTACGSRFAKCMQALFVAAPYDRRNGLIGALPSSPRYESMVQASTIALYPQRLNDSGEWSLSLALRYGNLELAHATLSRLR